MVKKKSKKQKLVELKTALTVIWSLSILLLGVVVGNSLYTFTESDDDPIDIPIYDDDPLVTYYVAPSPTVVWLETFEDTAQFLVRVFNHEYVRSISCYFVINGISTTLPEYMLETNPGYYDLIIFKNDFEPIASGTKITINLSMIYVTETGSTAIKLYSAISTFSFLEESTGEPYQAPAILLETIDCQVTDNSLSLDFTVTNSQYVVSISLSFTNYADEEQATPIGVTIATDGYCQGIIDLTEFNNETNILVTLTMIYNNEANEQVTETYKDILNIQFNKDEDLPGETPSAVLIIILSVVPVLAIVLTVVLIKKINKVKK